MECKDQAGYAAAGARPELCDATFGGLRFSEDLPAEEAFQCFLSLRLLLTALRGQPVAVATHLLGSCRTGRAAGYAQLSPVPAPLYHASRHVCCLRNGLMPLFGVRFAGASSITARPSQSCPEVFGLRDSTKLHQAAVPA